MEKKMLFELTADILRCRPADVAAFCMGGGIDDALPTLTPEDLSAQIREYEGK